MSSVRVSAVQMGPVLGDRGGNLRVIRTRLAEAAGAGALVVVFPECALTGYCFDSREEAMAQAEPVPGPSLDLLADSCADLGVFAVVGMLERDGDRLFNACALVGPSGELACYRKVHLPFMGVDRFADPGDRPFGVVEAAGLRLGLHICYDGTFPEAARVMSLRGADVLVLPTNWPPSSEPAALHLPIVRAIENTVFVMAVNRVGTERGIPFIGRSSIVDPAGLVLASGGPTAEEILIADLDPGLSRTKKLVRIPGVQEVDRFADRRPEFYGPIAEAKGKA
ncbi:carbon-nitrogen hydrolase family protein [Tautonia plasticadhaerens]|uniref:N-carbamoyl-D-amino acid hydrolase n=1 Tax=Tautonia plasticadhaerens TaxID=2527974 RepID=A0A518H588_9BACT|nr:carbon-nitrogen hydrolase family protein [Tautonia plasticadhaerens]QDV36006.1 N-carbamoyl-D-amino acid hydrolase [Tautonia plasticadhaerens]